MEHPESNNNEEQVPSELQSLFNKLLGVTVNLKDNFDSNEMRAFIYTINILDNFVQSENNVFDTSGIDLTAFTSPLWQVMEYHIAKIYGLPKAEVILWYILDRYEIDETVKLYIDNNEISHKIENTEQLWEYINSIK
jgi:hypothetical protein